MLELAPRPPFPPDVLGKLSKASVRAALKAHLEVGKGEPLRAALSAALRKEQGLGGQERRFVALCTRELSRHQRWLDLAARLLGHAPGGWALAEDRVLVRYVLWRRLFTGASWKEVGPEVRLPGPLRPRSVLDPVLERVAEAPIPPLPDSPGPVERAAIVHSFPSWLAERIASACGEARVDAVLGALNQEPDVWLRVRPGLSREQVASELSAEGVQTQRATFAPSALRVLGAGMKVFDTRAMRQARVQVQEPGSQLIAALCLPPVHPERSSEAPESKGVHPVHPERSGAAAESKGVHPAHPERSGEAAESKGVGGAHPASTPPSATLSVNGSSPSHPEQSVNGRSPSHPERSGGAAESKGALHLADICAGAGGKTLALADAVGSSGRVYAGDASKRRLEDARRRVREYGVKNVTFPDPLPLEKCDAVLIDAPCSGVGSLGREPDQKWKLTARKVEEFARTQRALLEEVAAKLRPGAVLVYATCSLLKEEDEAVVKRFLSAHPELELEPAGEVLGPVSAPAVEGPYLRVWPDVTRSAGFFAARMRRRR